MCSALRAPAAPFARAASCGCWCSPGGRVLFSQGSPRAVLAPHPMARSKTAPLLASLGSQRGCKAPHVVLRHCSWLLLGASLPSLAELLFFAECLAPSRTLGFSSSPGHGAPGASGDSGTRALLLAVLGRAHGGASVPKAGREVLVFLQGSAWAKSLLPPLAAVEQTPETGGE